MGMLAAGCLRPTWPVARSMAREDSVATQDGQRVEHAKADSFACYRDAEGMNDLSNLHLTLFQIALQGCLSSGGIKGCQG